jgi:glycerol-3-phosphate dehydrogenase
LQGAALYFDAQVPYAERLSVEQAVDAATAGATVLTHWRVTRLRRGAGSVNEVSLRDELTQAEAVVQAQAVVNAAGPWVDYVLAVDAAAPNRRLVRGSKGSHFTVARFPGAPPTGVHYEARSDARAILVLPVDDDRILIGSTDIFFEGDPGDAVCSDEEIDYLLGEVNQLIPTANLGPDDVLHSYAGVRPLPHTPAAKSTAEVSRDHHVVTSPGAPGLFSVVGGKLTTHRALGELAVDKVMRYLESSIGHPRRQTLVYRTAVRPLARTGSHSPTPHPLQADRAHRLVRLPPLRLRYGAAADRIRQGRDRRDGHPPLPAFGGDGGNRHGHQR